MLLSLPGGRRLAVTATATVAVGVTGCFQATSAANATPDSFGSEGTGIGQMIEPRGVAVEQASGDVYVADRKNNRIEKFTANGEFVLAWGWGVADGTSEALQTCTIKCFAGLEGAGAGQFNAPEGVAVDNDLASASHGDVYVLDRGNHRIQKFGPDGEFLLMFGGEGSGAGQFQGLDGRSVAVDAGGVVHVADENRVQTFSPGGVVGGELALLGAGLVENLVVDSAGDVYVQAQGLLGVHEYNESGTELGSPRDALGGPHTLSLGPASELFVDDLVEERHHIFAYSAAGKQVSSFDAGGQSEDGERGIAYGGGVKAVYVLGAGSVRIVPVPGEGPLVISQAAGEVQPTTARLEARVNPEGLVENSGEEAHFHFEYGESEAYGVSTPLEVSIGGNFEDRSVGVAVAGLHPSSTYHFRVVVTSAEGRTTVGPDRTFVTLPAVSIDSTSVSLVSATSARLETALNPHGLPGEYHFEYDTMPYVQGQAGHGTSTQPANAGEGVADTALANTIQNLTPSRTYHYRVVARNALGSVQGPDRSFTTQGSATALPDGREWELVSPPNKHGAPLEALGDADIQAAADGSKLTYIALAPVSRESAGTRSPEFSQLLSTRGPGGWATQEISTPHEEITPAKAGNNSEYRLFSEDLSAGIVEPEGATPLSPQTTERTPYRREADGQYVPLVTAANVPPGTHFAGPEAKPGDHAYLEGEGVGFKTATPDLSHVVLQSPQALTPGFGAGFLLSGNRENLYELFSGRLRLVSVLSPNGKGEEQPAAEADLTSSVGHNDKDERGAISSDGNRVVFETKSSSGEAHLYVRDLGLARTVQVDRVGAGAVGGQGAPVFKGASSDGGRVFFLDESRLTVDARASQGRADLYMCEVVLVGGVLSCELSDLTVASGSLESAGVQQVSAIDSTGTHLYFAANGVLTGVANTHGEHAVAGDCEAPEGLCNLYVEDVGTRQVDLVAVLAHADQPDWANELGHLTARTSPNGRFVVFMSERSLTGYDNRDAVSGALDEEVFLFDDSTGMLRCVSCDPSGARPHGVFDTSVFPGLLVDRAETWRDRWLAGSVPGWTRTSLTEGNYVPQSRYVSDDGRVFFDSADGLVPQDTNGVEDVYQWEPPAGEGAPASDTCSTVAAGYSPVSGGCVSLISSGTGSEESVFLDASVSGDDVFFLTGAQLSPLDVDTALDVYDAHVCSVGAPCSASASSTAACEGDACQNPVSAPNDVALGSLVFSGPGNLAPVVARPLTRAQQLARALKACKKDVRRAKRQKCEKDARAKYGPRGKKAVRRK